MKTSSVHKIVILVMALLLGVVMRAMAQSTAPDSAPKVTAEQKAQLQRLTQLEEQLQKGREALHEAISKYGWDSDEADEARDKLIADRADYRKLRRSLRDQGVAVPPPSGLGAGSPPDRPGSRAYRGYGRHHGYQHREGCGCPCGGS